MTIQECFAAFEGNYESALSRLRKETTVQKFIFKFLNDPSYDTLIHSMETNDLEEAFRAAHTLKGVCQNLSFDRLYESSSHLTEALRARNLSEAAPLLEQVAADYQMTVSAIRTLKEETSV